MRRQALYIGAGVLLAAASGLAAIPVMARALSPPVMAILSLFLAGWSMLGIVDGLRPVLIRAFRHTLDAGGQIPVRRATSSAFALGVATALAAAMVMYLAFQESFPPGAFPPLMIAVFAFFVGLPFWSILDASGAVGTGQLIRSLSSVAVYVGFAAGALYDWSVSAFLWWAALASVVAAAVWLKATIGRWTWREGEEPDWTGTDVRDTLKANAAKLWSDGIDRVMFGRYWDVTTFVAYSNVYDLAAKANIVPQYTAALLYPRLCAESAKAEQGRAEGSGERWRVFKWGLGAYFSMSALALVAGSWGDVIVGWYLGGGYGRHGDVVLILGQVAAVYSLAFFGQALLRAERRFAQLQSLLWLCAGVGTVVGAAGWLVLGREAAVVGVLLLKAPGLLTYSRYLRVGRHLGLARRLEVWSLLTCAGTAWIYTGSIAGAALILVGLAVLYRAAPRMLQVEEA